MRYKKELINSGYYVKVQGFNGKEVIGEVIEDLAVYKPKDNDEIGLQVFDIYLFD